MQLESGMEGVPFVLAPLRRLFLRLSGFWAIRGVLVGAVAASFDFTVLALCVRAFDLPRIPSIMLGTTTGACVGFVLNKYVAFLDDRPAILSQAGKYAGIVASEILLHAGLCWALQRTFAVHYVVAKIIADVLIFTLLHLMLMRFVVFARPHPGR